MDPRTYVVRAKQLLAMPEAPEELSAYDPDTDLEARDSALLGIVHDGALVVRDGTIEWIGPWSDRPDIDGLPVMETSVCTPGWIDCHTHAVFAGHRSAEFALRNAGRPYVEILEAGGGILNTVDAVRQSSTNDLAESLIGRVFDSIRRGVTTLEVKSGYGLTTADERKLLVAVKKAQPEVPCELVPCFLGAHAIPREFRDDRQGYVDLVCDEMIPSIAEEGLADYCDVFCDRGAFTVEESRRVLETGKKHGMIPRIHADELTDAGAAMLAAEVGASSADHLEFTPPDAIDAMAKAGVVAVIMPAVNLFLGTTHEAAPARALLAAGCEVAVATDFNPGSAMTQDIGLMTTLACTIHKLTPGESLRGVTIAAAKALRRDDIGRLRVGLTANLAMFDVPDYRSIPYHFGENHVEGVVYDGEFVYWTEVE